MRKRRDGCWNPWRFGGSRGRGRRQETMRKSPLKTKNLIITSVIVTVTSGLVDHFLELGSAAKAVSAAWGVLTGTWKPLTASQEVPVWLILVLGLAAIVLAVGVCLSIARAMTENAMPSPGSVRVRTSILKKYTSDTIYDVKWRWEWVKGEISNLRPTCPTCDAVLVYRDGEFDRNTKLICEPCSGIVKSRLTETTLLDFANPKVVAKVSSIDFVGLRASIRREIWRRVMKKERQAELAEAAESA